MQRSTATAMGGLIVAGLIGGATITNALLSSKPHSSLVDGDLTFASDTNDTHEIRGCNDGECASMLSLSGADAMMLNKPLKSSGGELNIRANLSLTEVNGYASGSLSIQNPYDEDIACDELIIDVTTASSPSTIVDVYAGTGAIGSMQKHTSGSLALFDNLNLGTGIYTSSGAPVTDAAGRPKSFKFYKKGTSTQPQYLNIVSGYQTGSLLEGSVVLKCDRL